MDIDRISYIFGSFARRRQSQEPSVANRKPSHERSRSTPSNPKRSFLGTRSSRAKSVIGAPLEDEKFKCPWCRNLFIEPRVLPCLHTFCLRCLQDLEGYDDNTDGAKPTQRRICCPSCNSRAEIPADGVRCFPPNYSVQHQMVLATLNSKSTHLLCDLCPRDVTATSRCMDCALSFCPQCQDLHLKEKSSGRHEVLSLEAARQRGITKVRRQVMCLVHPNAELALFCSTCYQVVCRECVALSHRSHLCEPISRAANCHIASLRMASEKAKALIDKSATDTNILNTTSKEVEAECVKIQNEIEKFIEDYQKSIQDHKNQLLNQIKEIRDEKLQQIVQGKLKLQKKISSARDIAHFLDDLLGQGSDVEVLSFIKPVIDKIEACDNLEPSPQLKYSDSIQFLPDEAVKDSNNGFRVYGVLTTQSIAAEYCKVNVEDFQSLRVGKRALVKLETRDNKDHPLERGGEFVTAEIRHREASVSRSLNVNVTDNRDGTYGISFTPDIAGKLIFIIKIKGEHIQGSPFPVTVRSLKPHHGIFHCCSFCSSGGNKEASCGCEGKMPGGYKGCGHGHDGHPGRRHWSCCGNVLEHSECGRLNSNSHYQFTL